MRIPYEDIVYAHRISRSTELVTVKSSTIILRSTLKELYEKLASERFIYIGRSCFVNIDHIMKVSNSMVILKSGDSLSVSRKMFPNVKSAATRLWGGIT